MGGANLVHDTVRIWAVHVSDLRDREGFRISFVLCFFFFLFHSNLDFVFLFSRLIIFGFGPADIVRPLL